MENNPLFGPVISRRLGYSLGIDLVLTKTCSYDCVYCECGPTFWLTRRREEFISVSVVTRELDKYLLTRPELDFITFAGIGEPTLSLHIGTVIRHIHTHHPGYRIAILTNGSLLIDPEVRKEILLADVVLPTFSTLNEETFASIHRPAPGITASSLFEGLIALRREYSGEIWLEIFIIPGMNDSIGEVTALRDAILKISPDRIQINHLDRPGTESWVQPLDEEELNRIITLLNDPRVEVAGSSCPISEDCKDRK